MKTKDVIDYVLSKKTISYYELNRLLYAFQYDRAVEKLPPLMDDAQFFATGRNVVVETNAEHEYCAFGASDIFTLGDKEKIDLNPEEKAVLDELMTKYPTVAMYDPEFFGKGSLVETIWESMPEQRPDLSILGRRPPISYAAMVRFVHGYKKQGTLNVRIPIDPYVKRTFEPLMRAPLPHEPYGIVAWRRILEWSNTPTPIYTIRLSIMAEDKDMPLGFVAELLCANCVVQSITFNEIPDRIPMEYDGYEFKITTK